MRPVCCPGLYYRLSFFRAMKARILQIPIRLAYQQIGCKKQNKLEYVYTNNHALAVAVIMYASQAVGVMKIVRTGSSSEMTSDLAGCSAIVTTMWVAFVVPALRVYTASTLGECLASKFRQCPSKKKKLSSRTRPEARIITWFLYFSTSSCLQLQF